LGILLQRLISLESWYVSACTLWNVNCHQKVPRRARPGHKLPSQTPSNQQLARRYDPWKARMAASYSRPQRNTSEPLCCTRCALGRRGSTISTENFGDEVIETRGPCGLLGFTELPAHGHCFTEPNVRSGRGLNSWDDQIEMVLQ